MCSKRHALLPRAPRPHAFRLLLCFVVTLGTIAIVKADPDGATFSFKGISGPIPFLGSPTLNSGILPPRYALVIGVNHYDPQDAEFDDFSRKVGDLTNSATDAELVGTTLQDSAGFVVTKIIPTPNHPLINRNDILSGITHFVKTINNSFNGTKPVVILYFAGHGMNYRGIDLFAPADFKPYYESDIAEMGITITEIQHRLNFANPAIQIVIADACRSNIEFKILKDGTTEESPDKLVAGFVDWDQGPKEGNHAPVPRIGDRDRAVIYATLSGQTASGGSSVITEGNFARYFTILLGKTLKDARTAAGNGVAVSSKLKDILDRVQTTLSLGLDPQRIEYKTDGLEIDMIPTVVDYVNQLETYKALDKDASDFKIPDPAVGKSTSANTNTLTQFAQIAIDRHVYCNYRDNLSGNLLPYSYFGEAALKEMNFRINDLLQRNFPVEQFHSICDDQLDLTTGGRIASPAGAPDKKSQKADSDVLSNHMRAELLGLQDMRAELGRGGDATLGETPKVGRSTTFSVAFDAPQHVFSLSDAARGRYLSDAARTALEPFDQSSALDSLAAVATNTSLFQFSNLSGATVAIVHRGDLVQVLDIGGTTDANESLRVKTAGGVIGYIRQEFVSSGRSVVAFVVQDRVDSKPDDRGDEALHYTPAADELLLSSIVIDVRLEYGDSSTSSPFDSALRVRKHFAKYWQDENGAERILPRVARLNPDKLPPVNAGVYLQPNVVRVVMSVLPLAKDLRDALISTDGERGSAAVATDISDLTVLSDLTNPLIAVRPQSSPFRDQAQSQQCLNRIADISALSAKSTTTVFVQRGPTITQSLRSEAIRTSLKSLGYGVPSAEKLTLDELPIRDEIRICPKGNGVTQAAQTMVELLNVCGLGDFSLKILNNYKPCASASRGNTVEMWTGRGVMTIYPKISFDNSIYKRQGIVLKNVLSLPQYAVSDVVYVNSNIKRNEIKVCDPNNAEDAKLLKIYLEKQRYNNFIITSLSGCDVYKGHNKLEVWLNAVPSTYSSMR